MMTHLQQPPLASSSGGISTFWLSVDGRMTRISGSGDGSGTVYCENGAGDSARGLPDSITREGGDSGDGDGDGEALSFPGFGRSSVWTVRVSLCWPNSSIGMSSGCLSVRVPRYFV